MQKRYKNRFFIGLLSLTFLASSFSQDNKQGVWQNMELDGYVSDMQSITASKFYIQQISAGATQLLPDSIQSFINQEIEEQDFAPWLKDNQLHTRLNYHWYINNSFTFSAQLRTRFNWGDQVMIQNIPSIGGEIESEFDGRLLSFYASDQLNFIFQSQFDRLWLQYTKDNFELKLGRQRINWAQTFAFNPNDIFNTYSFFDFDYEEKPGTDALKATYYTGMASFIETAASIDTANKVTLGGLWRFNKYNYDIQLLAGYMKETDLVAGLGWSGYIRNMSFRGEASYFHPTDDDQKEGVFVASIGGDYSFPNSLFIQAEFLYNEQEGENSLFNMIATNPSSKTLSFTEYTILASGSYTINPRLSTSLSALYYPEKKGFYTGPTLDFSLSDNASVSFISQMFSVQDINLLGEKERINLYMFFLRAKVNF